MEDLNVPKHIGFIMDGNGRWAKKRGMPRNFGHKQGAAVFKKTINWCREFGVRAGTFYAFSTENWKRPDDEVKGIMNLLRQYIKDIRAMQKENVHFNESARRDDYRYCDTCSCGGRRNYAADR